MEINKKGVTFAVSMIRKQLLNQRQNELKKNWTMENEVKEMSFEELLNENVSLCDKRRKAFKELKERMINTYIPSLCSVMSNAGIDEVYFKLGNQPSANLDMLFDLRKVGEDEEEFYVLYIDKSQKINEGDCDEKFSCYGTYLEYRKTSFSIEKEDLSNDCLIELAQKIKKKLQVINADVLDDIEKANKILG